MSVTLRLHEFLQDHNLSAYRLEKELEGQLARNSIYALAKPGGVKRLDLDSLSKVASVLSALLERPISLDELIAFDPPPHTLRRSASGFHYTGHPQTDRTLDAYSDLAARLAEAEALT